jgi:ATP-dependent protease ClpP protease subunit
MQKTEQELALFRNRVVLIKEALNESLVRELQAELLLMDAVSNQEIKLLINNSGGQLDSALYFCDFIQLLRSPVVGIVNGQCSSAAIVILQVCKKRLATKHSYFGLHDGTITRSFKSGINLRDNIEAVYCEVKEGDDRYNSLLLQRSRITPEQLQEMRNSRNEVLFRIDARKAVELGLIDAVVEDLHLF